VTSLLRIINLVWSSVIKDVRCSAATLKEAIDGTGDLEHKSVLQVELGALLSVKQRAAFVVNAGLRSRKKDVAQAGLSPVVVSVVRNPSDLLLYVSWMVSAAVSFTLSYDYFMHSTSGSRQLKASMGMIILPYG